MTTLTLPRIIDRRVTAVIVNYRTPDLAMACLAALDRERRFLPGLDAILVDGGSDDGSAEKLADAVTADAFADWVTFLPLAFNGGFGWANNQAIRRALTRSDPPEFIYLVNPDAVIEEGALALLVATLVDAPKAASAGSLLLSPEGHPLGSAFRFPTVAREFLRGANTPLIERLVGSAPLVIETAETTEADWVTGASVLLRAEALRDCGLFDEGFFLYFEEVELMHRLATAGWRSLHCPASRVWHVGGAATGVVDGASAQRPLPDYWFRSRRRFFAKAYGPLQARLSGIAWLGGYAIWRLREIAGLGRDSAHAPGEWRDLIRNGVGPSSLDRETAIGRWDGPQDQLPHWKTRS
ncbi:glycosyltransferase family 2 protein [Sphingomonas mollis]|uniref:Glycosyltransferase family 2 protein n=1 Tax=Sphingomonas mollis TaxID=2795726 RepID=A0ABS0XLA3_9SPHN|nr:glycosyltransferase family 2 protein [Sphingomonas sp. BT553]MBJ6120498.1 glycosyltransferase family 2 protein [Sphingomonas sp. BT553]